MCEKFVLGLAFASFQVQLQLPVADIYGRFPTFNRMGKVDPHPNEIVDAFVDWAVAKASRSPTPAQQKYALEVGGGYGFVAQRAVERGAYYIFNDASQAHVDIAESIVPNSWPEFQTFTGWFPDAWNKRPQLRNLQSQRIAGIGIFSVLHFMPGLEIRMLLDDLWSILEPGGRLFITAGTPWNGLFKGFPPIYREKKKRFFRDPGRYAYPGEIHNAWQYLSETEYPGFFHALDGDVLTYLAQANPSKAFRVVSVVPIQRPNPPQQAYRRGYRRGQTEIIGIILEKPEESQR